MKTPQEIARAVVFQSGGDDSDETLFRRVTNAIAAARAEGRREGIEQAYADSLQSWREARESTYRIFAALEARSALASQPKPEPAVTCDGCTAKPEGGKEPGT